MRTQIINDLMTNIFFNLIETEDRIAADERFEGLSSNDALEIYKVLSDQLIRTHIYAAHIGSGISSRIAMSILSSGSFLFIEDLSVSPEGITILDTVYVPPLM